MKVRIRIAYTTDLKPPQVQAYVNNLHHAWTQGTSREIHVVAVHNGRTEAEAGKSPKEKV